MSKPKKEHGRERRCPQCQRVMSGESYAFPFQVNVAECGERDYGLTKRELFAALICAGLSARPECTNIALVAKGAIRQADALIDALNEKESE